MHQMDQIQLLEYAWHQFIHLLLLFMVVLGNGGSQKFDGMCGKTCIVNIKEAKGKVTEEVKEVKEELIQDIEKAKEEVIEQVMMKVIVVVERVKEKVLEECKEVKHDLNDVMY
eukprot:3699_1